MSDIDRIEAVPVYCPTCEGDRLPLVNARGEIVCAGERHVIGGLWDWYSGDHEYDGTEDLDAETLNDIHEAELLADDLTWGEY